MLRVVGAGLGRTGTASLKGALEQLLGGRCYHMLEVFERPPDVSVWHAAVREEPVDWNALMAEYSACVDWPGCSVLERARGGEPRRARAPVHARLGGRVVEEHGAHDRPDAAGADPRG